jgi:hypothetical protein
MMQFEARIAAVVPRLTKPWGLPSDPLARLPSGGFPQTYLIVIAPTPRSIRSAVTLTYGARVTRRGSNHCDEDRGTGKNTSGMNVVACRPTGHFGCCGMMSALIMIPKNPGASMLQHHRLGGGGIDPSRPPCSWTESYHPDDGRSVDIRRER